MDIEITCVECGGSFMWTEKDQAFYKEKGFVSDDGIPVAPKRCRNCRAKKKARIASREGR